MAYEIIYTCNSINNKNIRRGELKILRKNEEGLYFEFGESENNVKKRYYNSLDVLNKDYREIEELKNKEEKEEAEEVIEEAKEEVKKEIKEEIKENKSKKNFKKNIF